jgi:hypothetical protein
VFDDLARSLFPADVDFFSSFLGEVLAIYEWEFNLAHLTDRNGSGGATRLPGPTDPITNHLSA